MAKDTKQAAKLSDFPRSNIFMVEPEALTVIDKPNHPFYDPREKLPVSEAMVESIIQYGVVEPVVVAKAEEDTLVVVDGIQRRKNLIEANKRLAKAGKEKLQLPVKMQQGDLPTLFAIKVLTNEIRQDDPPLAKAAKMQQFLAILARDTEDKSTEAQRHERVAVAFGTNPTEVRQHLKVLEAPAKVRKMVDEGKLAVSAGCRLVNVEPDKLDKVLDEALALGSTARAKGRIPTRQIKQAVKESRGSGPTAPSRGQIAAFKKAAGNLLHEEAQAALEWVLTGRKSHSIASAVKAMAEQEKEAKEAEEKKAAEAKAKAEEKKAEKK